jgi:hypothetical protein
VFGLLAVFALIVLLAGSAQAQLTTFGEERGDLTRASTTRPIWDDEDYDDGGNQGLGFGKKVAGTWLGAGTFSVDLGCDGTFDIPGIPFTDTQAFDVGGIHVVTNPGNPNSNLGTWEKTGMRQLSSRGVSFAVDMTPGGTVTSVAIISLVVDFDEDFETGVTTFAAKVYLPFQDPLDPAELPVACSLGSHDSFRKLSATE